MTEINTIALEIDMITYADLITVPVRDIGDAMVQIAEQDNLLINPMDPDMQQYTGENIYVRSYVATVLGQISLAMAKEDPDLQLEVCYGYRPLEIQIAKHEQIKTQIQLTRNLGGIDLIEAAHRCVAEPSVAGHPTGGAVDVQLVTDSVMLDFGTDIGTFGPRTYVYGLNPDSEEDRAAIANREKLRKYMTSFGFAPFNGEWWHFSLGDREWAKYWNKREANYTQIEFRSE